MSRDWIPAGSAPYDTAFIDGDYFVADDAGAGAYFSTVPYKPPRQKPQRNPKKCVGNDNTCEGWKTQGNEFCVGHMKAVGAGVGAVLVVR